MNYNEINENELSFVIDIEQDGYKIGEVSIPANSNNAVVAYLVHEAEEGLMIEMIKSPTRH